MKIDAKVVADHLSMIAMGKRIESVVLGPNFAAQVVDEAEEVMLKAILGSAKFPDKFGVEKVADLVKILESFGGPVDAEIVKDEQKREKLVLTSGDVTVWFQTADVDQISSTLTSFQSADESISKDVVYEVTPDNSFIENFSRYQKRIVPDLIEVTTKDKKLIFRMISATTRHRAEVVVGTLTAVSKKKFVPLKVGAAVLIDVLAGVKPTEGDQLKISVGKAIKIELRSYTYLVSPKVEEAESTEVVSTKEVSSKEKSESTEAKEDARVAKSTEAPESKSGK